MKAVDLFCGLGGISTGWARAGFEVEGWDIKAQPDYPFMFHQGDAVEVLRSGEIETDIILASPPCQAGAMPTHGNRKRPGWTDMHNDLIPIVRILLRKLWRERGIPYVIENVQGSQVRRDVTLCGLQFGLPVFRHRYFELGGWSAVAPPHPTNYHAGHRVSGWRHGKRYAGDILAIYGEGGGKATTEECKRGLGIDWSEDRAQLIEAVPPAYAQYLAEQFITSPLRG